MYSATGKDVLFLTFLILAEKNLSYHISSFNESTGFGLLKASPVEFVKYPFSCLQNKILFSKLKYCGLGNTVNGSCLFLSYGTTVPQKSCACTNQQHILLSYHHNFQGLTGTAFSLVFFISTFAGVPISSTSQRVIIRSCCKIMKHLSLTGFRLDALFL